MTVVRKSLALMLKRINGLLHAKPLVYAPPREQRIQENLRTIIGRCSHVLNVAGKAGVLKIVYEASVFLSLASDAAAGAYGFSKAEAERILAWYAQDLTHLALRQTAFAGIDTIN